jgi:hypothetical protein
MSCLSAKVLAGWECRPSWSTVLQSERVLSQTRPSLCTFVYLQSDYEPISQKILLRDSQRLGPATQSPIVNRICYISR